MPALASTIPSNRRGSNPASGAGTVQREIHQGSNPATVPGASTKNRADPTMAKTRLIGAGLVLPARGQEACPWSLYISAASERTMWRRHSCLPRRDSSRRQGGVCHLASAWQPASGNLLPASCFDPWGVGRSWVITSCAQETSCAAGAEAGANCRLHRKHAGKGWACDNERRTIPGRARASRPQAPRRVSARQAESLRHVIRQRRGRESSTGAGPRADRSPRAPAPARPRRARRPSWCAAPRAPGRHG